MIVNFEFFDNDPMKNVITNLNYKIDKTVFFCNEELEADKKTTISDFLQSVCATKEVEFCAVDAIDLYAITEAISDKVDEELGAGNQVYFDLTGGDSLQLVAFGMVSKDLQAPMHMYDMASGEMYEYGYEGAELMSQSLEYDPISLNLDEYIALYGGVINYRMHKSYKEDMGEDAAEDVIKTWELSRKYSGKWVYYCGLMRKFIPDANLRVQILGSQMLKEAQKLKYVGSTNAFKKFLRECELLGLIKDVTHINSVFSFTYKTEAIKNYFWDSGSILEMYTFIKELEDEEVNDCRVGVHIDWDGEIHTASDEDVLNEVDVISMKNNQPTFISCKIGNVDQMALYELDAVASRFGGRGVKKALSVAKEVSPSHQLRAKEMGIEIRLME